MACPHRPHRPVLAAALAASLGLAGCASTRLDAQWSDSSLRPNLLRGAKVLVACEAYEPVIRQICLDQVSAEVVARGGTPVKAPDTTNPAPGRPLGDEQYLGAARSSGAKAIFTTYITPSGVNTSPGFTIGIGGFGVGSGGFGGGVGVSAPIGGGQVTTGYAASARVTDTASGRLVWTAKASSPPSQNVQGQLGELAKAVFGAADKASLF